MQLIFVQCRQIQTIHFIRETFIYCKIHSLITTLLGKNSWEHVQQCSKTLISSRCEWCTSTVKDITVCKTYNCSLCDTAGYPRRVDSSNTPLWKLQNFGLYSCLWKQCNTESRVVQADTLLGCDACDEGCFFFSFFLSFFSYSGWFSDYMNL